MYIICKLVRKSGKLKVVRAFGPSSTSLPFPLFGFLGFRTGLQVMDGFTLRNRAKPPTTCRFALFSIHFLQICPAAYPLAAILPENPEIRSSIDIRPPTTCKFVGLWTTPIRSNNPVECKTQYNFPPFAVELPFSVELTFSIYPPSIHDLQIC